MSVEGGIMRMRPLAEGIPVSPGARVTLAPGGYHLMLIGLTKQLRQGELVPVTLRFERAGAVNVQLHVEAPGAEHPSGGER